MKKNKISKNWINKQRRDIFVKKSKIEGYRSRAVYKLQEIDHKFKIFKNGISVIDLGAAPGSWSQYALKNIKNGKIVSIDLLDFEKIGNIHQIKGDFTEDRYKKEIIDYFGSKVDVVLSDMAVNTTGNKNIDSIYTGELCMEAMQFSKNWLNKRRRDIYVRKSKLEGYRSRAVYKLQEIDDKFKIFKNGISVIDLGAAPGSWSQFISKRIKN